MNNRPSDLAGESFTSRAYPNDVAPLIGAPPQLSPLEEFLVVASRLNSSISDLPIFSDHGIGSANWALLKLLESGSMSTEQLAQRANLSRQRVRVQVKELEAKHFLSVTRQDEGDRRLRIVHILPRGTATLLDISIWLQSRSQRENSKRLLIAIKQIRLLQRLFHLEKISRAREERFRKKSGDKLVVSSDSE